MQQTTNPIRFLLNRAFWAAMLSLVIQQVIVASSTFWISQVAKEVSLGQDFRFSLLLFILSLIIVYLPGSTALFYLEKAKRVATQHYIEQVFTVLFNQTTQRNSPKKAQTLPMISAEAALIFHDGAEFLFGFISVVLNVLANIAVLAMVIEQQILLYYFLGITFSFLIILFSNKTIRQQAKYAQQQNSQYKGILYLFWDNVILGNQHNYQIYQNELTQSYKNTLAANLRKVLINNLASNLGMIVMIAPVGYYTWQFFMQNQGDSAVLAVLVATLPRQILMLQYAYNAISQGIDFLGIYARFRLLADYLIPETENAETVFSRIQFEQLNAVYNGEKYDVNLLKHNQLPEKGRITLRGNNGSGKSTLLGYLKQKNQQNAFYLPANSQLFFQNTLNQSLSTGETIKYALLELSDTLPPAITLILLDEWDANLDHATINELNARIEQLSQQRLVIEIRHR